MGIERLIELIDASGVETGPDAYLVAVGERAQAGAAAGWRSNCANADARARLIAVPLRRRQLQEPVQEGRPQRRTGGADARR
jgi:hypothetical protein